MDGPSIDGFGGNEQELGVEGEATQDNIDLDGQLTQEQFHSTAVGCISNDFNVNEFEREEEKDRIGDVVRSDSDDSDVTKEVQMLCQHRLMSCQYRFILCHYQYQLRFCMVSRLRVD